MALRYIEVRVLTEKTGKGSSNSGINRRFFLGCFRSHDLKLVMPLPYDPKKWNPREVIRMLVRFSKIDMDNVMWQLGSGTKRK